MYDLGIIGGMGPLASAVIYKKIINKTKINKEQDHLDLIILSKASIYDRTLAILKEGPSPVKQINEAITDLVKLNVKNFFIACNTAHYFKEEFKIPSSIKFLNLIDETLIFLKEKHKNHQIIVLGTKGTIASNIYKTSIYSQGLSISYPNGEEQNIIMDFIYKLKEKEDEIKLLTHLDQAFKSLIKRFNQPIFVLACTELSIFSEVLNEKYNVIDTTDIIITKAIQKSGYEIVK